MEPITGLEPVNPDYKSGALPAKLYRRCIGRLEWKVYNICIFKKCQVKKKLKYKKNRKCFKIKKIDMVQDNLLLQNIVHLAVL